MLCHFAGVKFVGLADDIQIDGIYQVIQTINPELFEEMEKEGLLVSDETPGIYHVKGYTNFPFQIIITGELRGDEYAAYRALTDRADAAAITAAK